MVALKALVVIHRALREGGRGGGAFAEELLGHGRQRGHALQMSNFKDDSSHLAWDCSAWVRTYALFLEERLECLAVLRYDVEAERLRPPPAVSERAPPKVPDALARSQLLLNLGEASDGRVVVANWWLIVFSFRDRARREAWARMISWSSSPRCSSCSSVSSAAR